MTTILDVLSLGVAIPIRRLYLKRRLFGGGYESDFIRIDNLNNDNVLSWGGVDNTINGDPGEPQDFSIQTLTLILNNSLGLFSAEKNSNSLFNNEFTYIRHLSIVKIEAGYDVDGVEIGVSNIFEGFINKITISENSTATISVISKINILTKYNISDLLSTEALPDLPINEDKTASFILNAILNQSKITNFLSITLGTISNDYTFKKSELSGTYFDVIKTIIFLTGSRLQIIGGGIIINSDALPTSVSATFYGKNSNIDRNNIQKIISYDDEGRDRVRTRFYSKGGAFSETTTDSNILTKYFGQEKEVDLDSIVSDSEKQAILLRLITDFQYPKLVLKFQCRFCSDFLKIGDKIKVVNKGNLKTDFGIVSIWGLTPSVYPNRWAETYGSIILRKSQNWRIIGINHDLNNYTSIINVEAQN